MELYSTNKYKIVAEDGEYLLIHKESEVIEGRHFILPKAIAEMETYNGAVERYEQKQKEGLANVVAIGTKG